MSCSPDVFRMKLYHLPKIGSNYGVDSSVDLIAGQTHQTVTLGDIISGAARGGEAGIDAKAIRLVRNTEGNPTMISISSLEQ